MHEPAERRRWSVGFRVLPGREVIAPRSPHFGERLLWMAPALQEKFDVLALVGSSLLFGLLMQSTLDCWP
jgi:hypothetical protein